MIIRPTHKRVKQKPSVEKETPKVVEEKKPIKSYKVITPLIEDHNPTLFEEIEEELLEEEE